ncbi:hypothetical protein BJX66DRAFT_17433 [Aspergillus keveii]|uniref:C2H2-type domain-containing protein n=1 Tax=Aspergillus keveii TaxID=714993 RepID=A0ABR4FVE4_9EURO
MSQSSSRYYCAQCNLRFSRKEHLQRHQVKLFSTSNARNVFGASLEVMSCGDMRRHIAPRVKLEAVELTGFCQIRISGLLSHAMSVRRPRSAAMVSFLVLSVSVKHLSVP